MAIAMRILTRIFFFATEVTPGPLLSVQYTHIKRPPNSRCAICSGFEDTTKMRAHSRGTCQADLAADRCCVLFVVVVEVAVCYLLEFYFQLLRCCKLPVASCLCLDLDLDLDGFEIEIGFRIRTGLWFILMCACCVLCACW